MARLDFDSEGVEELRDFDLLPDGTEVRCVLESSEIVENKKGDGSYLKLTFDSIDDAHPGRFSFGRDVGDLLSAEPDDVIMAKVSWWIGR